MTLSSREKVLLFCLKSRVFYGGDRLAKHHRRFIAQWTKLIKKRETSGFLHKGTTEYRLLYLYFKLAKDEDLAYIILKYRSYKD